MNAPKIDFANKTITVTKSFYKKAQRAGTAEFNLLMDAMNKAPTFSIEFKTTKKQTYRNLSYGNIEAFIKASDREDVDAILEEFERVKKQSKAQTGPYAYVKSWFLGVFPDFKEFESKFAKKDDAEGNEAPANENKTVPFPATAGNAASNQ